MEKVNIVDRIKAKIKFSDIWIVGLIFVLLMLVFATVYWNYKTQGRYIFPPIGADKGAELGQLGDYFGGLLNPVFGAITIIFVFVTFLVQRRQLELARKEHKINLLQSEHRYIFSGLSTSLQTNGIDVGGSLSWLISHLASTRGVDIQGDLTSGSTFSYYKLACEAMKANDQGVIAFREMVKKCFEFDRFAESRVIIYCKSTKCMQEVSGELTGLLNDFSGVKLNVESEFSQIKEIFSALGIDYEKTALDGKSIIWTELAQPSVPNTTVLQS